MHTSKPNAPDASPFTLLSTREAYRNPWISVREDRVLRPGGAEGVFGVVTMKPGSSILPITEDGQTFLTWEYRYALGCHSIEVASGALEEGEEPLAGAQRELEEELGLVARDWIDLGHIDPFTTVISSRNFMYVAMGLKSTAQRLDSGEEISIRKMPFARALEMVMTGEISHGASCVLILKANVVLKARGISF